MPDWLDLDDSACKWSWENTSEATSEMIDEEVIAQLDIIWNALLALSEEKWIPVHELANSLLARLPDNSEEEWPPKRVVDLTRAIWDRLTKIWDML